MEKWLYIIMAVFIAVAANSISTVWAAKADKFNIWLLFLIIISPFVFITFGLVTSRIGLALSSGTIDSLLTISTILVGLFIFKEWDSMSMYHYIGMSLTLAGIFMMHIEK